MRIIYLSYAQIKEQDPYAWLKKLSFYVGVLEALTKYGCIKSVHCISYKGILSKNQVEYHFLNQHKWQLYFPFQLHSYLKKLDPEVVIVQGLIFPWQVILLRWQLGRRVKIIAQHHAERPFRDPRGYLQRWADNYIAAYLFCSIDQGMQWVLGKHIRHASKIKEIMGTSSAFYKIEKNLAKQVTRMPCGANYLWVGRLDDNKDPLLVARAFIRFNKAYPTANLFMIYQTFELLPELKSVLSKESGADRYIHLVGKVQHEDLLYWYNSADFIISSSHYEGSGVAVCEGLSCGCIPILTDIPSFRMMTDNGRIGLLYKAGDERALLNALERSLGVSRTTLKQLVLEQFHQKLSFDANAKGIMEVIYSL